MSEERGRIIPPRGRSADDAAKERAEREYRRELAAAILLALLRSPDATVLIDPEVTVAVCMRLADELIRLTTPGAT